MIRFGVRPRGAVALVLIGALLAVAPATHAQEAIGRVVRHRGEVSLIRDGEPAAPADGAALMPGDAIATGPDARVEVAFADGSALFVGPDTRLALDEGVAAGAGSRLRGVLDLAAGIVRLIRGEDGPPDRFEVHTRAAVASVRSTEWVVIAEPERSSVFVARDRVAVFPTGDVIGVLLREGEGTDVPNGGRPTPPKRWGQARVADALARTRP